MSTLTKSNVVGFPRKEGKVRDIYTDGDHLILVATDRISAFDWVLPTPIPEKGVILTALSRFWFSFFESTWQNHTCLVDEDYFLPEVFQKLKQEGRVMVCRKADRVFPIEAIARGHITGSAWKSYQEDGTMCGIKLPKGMKKSQRFAQSVFPYFTPSTKAEEGHDQNISFAEMENLIGVREANCIRDRCCLIFKRAYDYTKRRGVIIADTKFEVGLFRDAILLIDEMLTPDSSRFWPAQGFKPGESQPSFDKQFVRDYLETTGWDKESPPPELPEDVVTKTTEKYIQAYEMITGRQW